jgi:nucleoside-diphosphate-sugar epimerase
MRACQFSYSSVGRVVCGSDFEITDSKVRVLVTGDWGFLVMHCLERLATKSHDVHAVSTVHQISTSVFQWHRVNLLKANEVRTLISAVRPSHLIHLARYTDHGTYWHTPENLAWVRASLGLMQEFTDSGGRA